MSLGSAVGPSPTYPFMIKDFQKVIVKLAVKFWKKKRLPDMVIACVLAVIRNC